jgi:hypothetical protein
MTEVEKIFLASKAFSKNWDFEELKYGDDLYNKTHFADDIWKYLEEIEIIGVILFKNKYKDIKLYF